MSKARSKGTAGENFFLSYLRNVWPNAERAPLKGTLDYGDFLNVPWLHESKSTAAPHFLEWAKVARRKVGSDRQFVILWKGDLRLKDHEPLVVMPLGLYMDLVGA